MGTLIRWLFPSFLSGFPGAALLLVRLVMGFAFILHGWPKIKNPTSWAGDAFPAAVQIFVAVAEIGGGAFLLLGLLTPVAAALLLGVMIGAINFHVQKGDPFVGRDGSYELALVYAVLAIQFLFLGPGRFSADAQLFGRKKS